MSTTYQVPEATKVGHIHLKVSDIHRSLSFYRDLLGFQVMAWYDEQAVFLSSGGYHHQIGRGSRQTNYV
jgi:catechol 2,3-dioxygenase